MLEIVREVGNAADRAQRKCSQRRDEMPTYTVGLLELRVVHNSKGTDCHVSNFGPRSTDLLVEWQHYLKHVQGVEHGCVDRERYFIPVKVRRQPRERRVQADVDYGRFGTARRVRDTGTGIHTGNVAPGEIAGDELRTLMAVPMNGYAALLAHESVGLSTISGIASWNFKKWFHDRHPGYRLSIDYLDDKEAWDEFLGQAELKAVQFLVHRQAQGNRAGQPTKEIYKISPERGEVLPARWINGFRYRDLRPGDVLNVPVNDNDVSETKLVVERDGRRRTIAFGLGEGWPRFTWEIDPGSSTRPVSGRFYGFAEELIKERLKSLGVDE